MHFHMGVSNVSMFKCSTFLCLMFSSLYIYIAPFSHFLASLPAQTHTHTHKQKQKHRTKGVSTALHVIHRWVDRWCLGIRWAGGRRRLLLLLQPNPMQSNSFLLFCPRLFVSVRPLLRSGSLTGRDGRNGRNNNREMGFNPISYPVFYVPILSVLIIHPLIAHGNRGEVIRIYVCVLSIQ
ncbi:hypothetical protein BDV95DRAFT_269215 [Massariosphaeria phaeospora]|uniref:Uncharacterized protein n=1 Tax=Massariosphaeria phaeospora TaxID=100035 RepID=A0A7C8M3W7_9PLEO|nr:hypothetical protein BDV95DRAFT_269215 [Massariosphaeria phaeospora]